jgi:hypothetical protein
MLRAGFVRNLAVIALVAVSCGPSHGTAPPPASKSNASAARQQCPADQTTPHFVPAPPSNRNLEIVFFKGSQRFLVRDITDILHPTTVSTFDDLWKAQFVSSSEISYTKGTDLIRFALAGSPRVVVAHCVATNAFAWNSTGTNAAYITINRDTSAGELHLVGGGRNRMASSMPPMGITGCESRTCADDFDFRLMYSPDGAYLSFIKNFGGAPNLRIWNSDGQLLQSVDSSPSDFKTGPAMSAWSGDSFYWRDGQGIEMWHRGTQSLALPGVRWIRPKASPGGNQIVYETRDVSGTAHIYLLDTRSNVSRELIKSRSEPAYLNAHLIWYQEERPCDAKDQCPPETTTIPSGKTDVYDLQDNTETESVIDTVWDVWPHPA